MTAMNNGLARGQSTLERFNFKLAILLQRNLVSLDISSCIIILILRFRVPRSKITVVVSPCPYVSRDSETIIYKTKILSC